MKIIKDIVFLISVGLWLLSDIGSFLIWGSIGITMMNIGFIFIFGFMVLIQKNVKKFGNWLEKSIKR